MGSKMNDEKILEFVLAGQIIYAHKAISAGFISTEEAADLLDMDVKHLSRLFDKLGLDQPDKEMTFDEMLDKSVLREEYFTAEDIRKIFLSKGDDHNNK